MTPKFKHLRSTLSARFVFPAMVLSSFLLTGCGGGNEKALTDFDLKLREAITASSSIADPWEAFQWLVLSESEAIAGRGGCFSKWLRISVRCPTSEAQVAISLEAMKALDQATRSGNVDALKHLYAEPVSFFDSYAGLRKSNINFLRESISKGRDSYRTEDLASLAAMNQ